MGDKFQFQASEEKQNFDFSNPDLNEAAQIFNAMFGDSFPTSRPVLPEDCVLCRHCEGTGRVIRIKKHLFGMGTSKTVTNPPCPHCEGKGYVPSEETTKQEETT